jgi:hypothetical protein
MARSAAMAFRQLIHLHAFRSAWPNPLKDVDANIGQPMADDDRSFSAKNILAIGHRFANI